MGSGYQALGIHRLFLMSGYHGNVKLHRSTMPSMASTTHPSLIEGQGESPVPHCPSSSSQLQLPTSIKLMIMGSLSYHHFNIPQSSWLTLL
jgi:hypothetical protein